MADGRLGRVVVGVIGVWFAWQVVKLVWDDL